MRAVYLFILSVFLTGCAPKYVYITEKTVVEVPKSLFIYPDMPEPEVKKEEYLVMTPIQREVMLGNYNLDLQKVITSYRVILKKVEDYIDEHKAIVERISEESKRAKHN